MFGKVKRLKAEIDSLTRQARKEKQRAEVALDMLCENCPIYQNYGMRRYLRCDAINCPIFSKVVLLIDNEER